MSQGWLSGEPLKVVIDDVHVLYARPKVFTSGSRGWYLSGKVEVGGERCQVSCCITVIGSKVTGGSKSEKGKSVEVSEQGPGPAKTPRDPQEGQEAILEVEGPPPRPWLKRRVS